MRQNTLHICGDSGLICKRCDSPATWLVGNNQFCEKHYKEFSTPELSQPKLTDKDIQALAECALRYALNRRTYITSVIGEAIQHIPVECLSRRSIAVMRRDLARYFESRDDDECDFQNWKSLDNYLKTLDKDDTLDYN